jgi:hypothetical protein
MSNKNHYLFIKFNLYNKRKVVDIPLSVEEEKSSIFFFGIQRGLSPREKIT